MRITTSPGRREHTRPHPVRHEGPCGPRLACPLHGKPFGPAYSPAERRPSGVVLAHDCGRVFIPGEPLELARLMA